MPEHTPAALRAVVRGRVQGVGFREFVLNRARFLAVSGYVRNLPDGRSLEVVAEGSRSELEQLLSYLREGPRLSRVDAVDADWGEPTGAYDGFGVGYLREAGSAGIGKRCRQSNFPPPASTCPLIDLTIGPVRSS